MPIKCSPILLSEKDIERFWSKVDQSGGPDACWIFTGVIGHKGYGLLSLTSGGRHAMRAAHRISWTIANGPIPDGLFVLHNCPDGDNRACVNPAHLWLGTIAENNRDAFAKGRQRVGEQHPMFLNPYRGENHPSAKVNDAIVREIKRDLARGLKQRVIAERFGVSVALIGDINTGRYWSHVTI